MKTQLTIGFGVLLFLVIGFDAHGQTEARKKMGIGDRVKYMPARGYYRQLGSYSSKPKSSDLEVDKLKFPYNPDDEKRLNRKPVYLADVTINDFQMPDPPANSSEQTRAELNYLISLAGQRSAEDVRSSRFMSGVYYNPGIPPTDTSYARYRKNLFFIGRSIGTWFNPETLPLTADLMANVWRDANFFIWSFKLKYARVRPYMLDPNVNNLEVADAPSYPGGHATTSYVLAYLYQELAPEFADTFTKDAFDMAHSREIVGVHYPSDSEVSRMLARQLVDKLLQNKKFLKDLEGVRKEWSLHARELVN